MPAVPEVPANAGRATPPPASAAVWLATNRIGFSLYLPEVSQNEALELMIEDRDAVLVASVLSPGWLPKVSPDAQSAFLDMLSGTLKLGGVQAFKPHTAWQVGCRPDQIEIEPEGLVIRRDDGQRTPIVRPEALLQNRDIRWSDWVNLWQKDQAAEKNMAPLLLKREMVV